MVNCSNKENNYMVDMKSICKEFPGVVALVNVDFAVKEGEIRALIGENGAGKSTLVKILSGVYPDHAYRGDIYLKGERVAFDSISAAEDHQIAMIPQEIEIIPELSVAENIYLNHQKTKNGIIDWDHVYFSAEKELEKINLKIDVREPIRNFSSAIQRMVSIAEALSKDAKILILDEPTAALTEEEINTLFGILRDLKSKGVTIIFISHKISELFDLCDSLSVMRDGEMIATKEINEVNSEEVVEMMTGRKIGTLFPKEESNIGEKLFEIKNFSVLNSKTRKNIVSDADLYVRKGEILGVFGLVGSGRTELFSAVYGLEPKHLYSGEVYINNKKLDIKDSVDCINNGIGLITEERKNSLFLDFSVNYNITIANLEKLLTAKFVLDNNKEAELSHKYIKKLAIKVSNLNQLAKQLSGGNQQKVLLARWLAKNLSVLILDEPTRGIDVGAKVEIYKLMNEMASRGMGIIFISSELPEITGMSDRIIVVHRGKIKGELQRAEATEHKILNLATGGL